MSPRFGGLINPIQNFNKKKSIEGRRRRRSA
jgi:hypothetical protein